MLPCCDITTCAYFALISIDCLGPEGLRGVRTSGFIYFAISPVGLFLWGSGCIGGGFPVRIG